MRCPIDSLTLEVIYHVIDTMEISAVSWNVEGIRKLQNLPGTCNWLRQNTVVFMQESLHLDDAALNIFRNVTIFDQKARPTAGRPSGGLITMFENGKLGHCEFTVVDTGIPGTQLVRVEDPSEAGIKFFALNVYVPAFDPDVEASLFEELRVSIMAQRQGFPSFAWLIGGDFNGHLRTLTASPSPGTSPRAFDRAFQTFDEQFRLDGFDRWGGSNPTFIGKTATAIDFFYTEGFTRGSFHVKQHPSTLHQPIVFVGFLCEFRVSSDGLLPASAKFKVPPGKLAELGDLLLCWEERLLQNKPFPSAQEVYDGIFRCIMQFAKPSRAVSASRDISITKSGWYAYLSDKEFADLQAAEQAVARLLECQLFGATPSELKAARGKWNVLHDDCRKKVAQRILDETRISAANRGMLWKVCKKFRGKSFNLRIQPSRLLKHFQSTFSAPGEPLYHKEGPLDDSRLPIDPEDPSNSPFVMDDLKKVISDARKSSAGGPDGVSTADTLMLLTDERIGPIFLRLFNLCFLQGSCPWQWGKSEVFLLFKGKGSVQDPDNYRGITLLDASYKIYERLVHARIYAWAEGKGHLGSEQYGFRQHRSTLDAIFALQTVCRDTTLQRQRRIHLAFLDLKKAFPSVNRRLLLSHLKKLGLPGRLWLAVAATLSGNTVALRIGSLLAPGFYINRGVREGSVLAPLLFILFFAPVLARACLPFAYPSPHSDPVLRCPNREHVPVTGLLYADDLVILATTRSALNERMRLLARFLNEVCLTLSVAKSEILTIFPRQGPSRFRKSETLLSVHYQGEQLPEVSRFKYLGYWFGKYVFEKTHEAKMRARAMVAANLVASIVRELAITDWGTRTQLFQSLVLSQFYGVEVSRGPTMSNDMAAVARRFVRRALGLPQCTTILFTESLNKLPPWPSIILKRKLGFLSRLMTQPPGSAVFHALAADRSCLLLQKDGWFQDLFEQFFRPVSTDLTPFCDPFVTAESAFQVFKAQRVIDREQETIQRVSLDVFRRMEFRYERDLEDMMSELSRSPLERQRRFLLFLTNTARWCILDKRAACPLCDVSWDIAHWTECQVIRRSQAAALSGLVSSSLWLNILRGRDWEVGVLDIPDTLEIWERVVLVSSRCPT